MEESMQWGKREKIVKHKGEKRETEGIKVIEWL